MKKKEFNFKGAKRVGPKFRDSAVKVTVTSRLDEEVVDWLRSESEKKGLPYQTFMNSILTEAMNGSSEQIHTSSRALRKLIREELGKKRTS